MYIKSFLNTHALWTSSFSLMSLHLEYNKDSVKDLITILAIIVCLYFWKTGKT